MEQKYPITIHWLGKYNRPGTALHPVGLVLHATAVYGDTDEAEVGYFETANRSASAHYFVDFDSITQDIPDNEEAWHAGPYANSHFLSIESCQVRNDGSAAAKDKFQQAYDRYVWLAASKCVQYGWDPKNSDQLMSHAMVSAKWKEVAHTDPCGADGKSGYFGTWGITWDKLVSDIVAEVENLRIPSAYVMDKLYVVNAAGLNIRQQPDSNSAVVGQLTKGTVIHIRNKLGAWFLTSWGPQGGWVYGQYVDPYNPPAPKLTNSTTPKPVRVAPGHPILGANATESSLAMTAFATKCNPDFPPDLAALYLGRGKIYGVRGDVAFCQMLKETDFYKFGGDVKIEQNNMAGLGTTGGGVAGASFDNRATGVEAHLQHLYAYASTGPLPDGTVKVDPRFDLVARGSAKNWEDLNGKWAVPGVGYGEQILQLTDEVLSFAKTYTPPVIQVPVVTALPEPTTGSTQDKPVPAAEDTKIPQQQANILAADLDKIIKQAQSTLKDLEG